MRHGYDPEEMAYLNPAAAAMCCSDQVPGRDKPGMTRPGDCRGQYRGMWKPNVAYARGDVVYTCPDYEQPSAENLWRATRTHCATEDDRPESGIHWMQTWQVRLQPGQPDNLDEF